MHWAQSLALIDLLQQTCMLGIISLLERGNRESNRRVFKDSYNQKEVELGLDLRLVSEI